MKPQLLRKLKLCMKKAGHVLTDKQLTELYNKHRNVFDVLPDDILVNLIEETDHKNIAALCRVSKRMAELCKRHKDIIERKNQPVVRFSLPLRDDLSYDEWFEKFEKRVVDWGRNVFEPSFEYDASSGILPIPKTELLIPLEDVLGYTVEPGPVKRVKVHQSDTLMFSFVRKTYYHLVMLRSNGTYDIKRDTLTVSIKPNLTELFKYFFGAQLYFFEDGNRITARGKAKLMHPLHKSVDSVLTKPKTISWTMTTEKASRTGRFFLMKGQLEVQVNPMKGKNVRLDFEVWNHPTGVVLVFDV